MQSNGNSADPAVQFNGDSAGNYSFYIASSSPSSASGAVSLDVVVGSGAFWMTMDINNSIGTIKTIDFKVTNPNGISFSTSTMPFSHTAIGLWGTTTPQSIHTITLVSAAANTQMYIYGSSF